MIVLLRTNRNFIFLSRAKLNFSEEEFLGLDLHLPGTGSDALETLKTRKLGIKSPTQGMQYHNGVSRMECTTKKEAVTSKNLTLAKHTPKHNRHNSCMPTRTHKKWLGQKFCRSSSWLPQHLCCEAEPQREWYSRHKRCLTWGFLFSRREPGRTWLPLKFEQHGTVLYCSWIKKQT